MSNHIANDAYFAKTVLMPGDPLRAKYIAENFLVDYKEVTSIRGILGYTGKTKDGRDVSVMASGMGCPSIGIYSYELFTCYGVEKIIRIGTAGSTQKDCRVGSIVVGTSASSSSNYGTQITPKGCVMAPVADFELMMKAYQTAKELNIPVKVGPIFSSDVFYDENEEMTKTLEKVGVLACEMEAYALYVNAMLLHKKALAICTISDSLVDKGAVQLTKLERQTKLHDMIKMALSMVD